MKATVTIETIKPEQARIYLDNLMEGQRNMREMYWRRLATEMAAGQWRLSPDAIVFLKDKLANGQHRMRACAECGRPVTFLVLRSDDTAMFEIIDAGMKRTLGDALKILDGEYISAVASVANLVVDLDGGYMSGKAHGASGKATRTDKIHYAKSNWETLQQQVAFCAAQSKDRTFVPVSVMAAVLHLGSRKNKTKSEEFITKVYSGTSHGDSTYDLRERLIKNASTKAKLPRGYVVGIAIKALKSYLNGTRPGVLKIGDGEEFPTL